VQHAVDLVVASHPQHAEAPQAVRDYVRFGSSPRGAQSLVLAAKAAALLDGRPNASVDDVRALAPAVMQHRMVLGYEALADNVAAAKVVADILEAVPSPGSGLRGAP
jgi:MoxR-like ATPase